MKVSDAATQLINALRRSLVYRYQQFFGNVSIRARQMAAKRRVLDRGAIAIVSGFDRPTPPLAYGGVEVPLYAMARDLRDRGWRVHLFGMFQDGTALYEGMTLHSNPARLLEDLLEINPGVVYLAWSNRSQLEALTADSRRVVIGEYNHPTCLPALVAGIKVRCLNALFQKDAVVAGFSPEDVFVIPYWQHDETSYRPEIKREDWLLWVGRPDRTKALEEAFRFSMLTGIELRFAAPWYPGDAEWAQVLERVRPPTVKYLGEITRAQKHELFSRCRALLYTARPDYKEAFGLIFLEALCSGTPLVALDHHEGSTQSWMYPGTPVGIRAATTEALAELWMQHGDELRPDAVIDRCRRIYDPKTLADQMDATIRAWM